MELRRAASGLLLLVLLVALAHSSLWPDQHPMEELLATRISGTLQKIFTNAFAAHNISVFISTAYKQMARDRVQLVQRVLDRSLGHRQSAVPIVLASRLSERLSSQVLVQLLFVECPEEVIAIASDLENNGLYLIVWLTTFPESKQAPVMSRIFAYFLLERYNINVLILVPSFYAVRAYNARPYTPTDCMSLVPVRIELKDAGIWDIFPPRLKNLYGCPLSVIVWDIPPYMTVHWEKSEPAEQLEGLDGLLLQIVAAKMNFTMRLIRNEPEGLIGGSSYVNGTLTGAYQMLRERRANFTLGCAACTPERSTYLAATGPYSQMAYVIVMRPRSGYSIYEVMLFPFNGYAWLLLAFVSSFHWLLGSHWRLPSPALAGWMLWIFVIRASYEASVFNFIHNSPVKPLPQTFEQTLAAGFHFITDHATYRMTLKLPAFEGRTSISPGQPVDVFDALLREPGRAGAFTSRVFLAQHLTRHRNHRHRLVILAEKMLDNMLCVYFPPGSYFALEFNEILFNMRSFGLFQHHSQRLDWGSMPTTSDSLGRSANPRSSSSSSCESAVKGRAESMGFVLAAFNCLMASFSISLAVLGLELLSQRRPSWRRLAWLMERL
ncbi:uncharacterized protein Ir7d [Drosophila kikkawai]|uniref:Uncharacterized protein Ir7d n=1 Tax=Drosophila kikkawai TaxID=30033 RepID=A0A6P4I5P1_DROKI|nr:uncharacterized protein LOC108071667 [Drosophila kikkawai]